MGENPSIIFQSAKLGDIPEILAELRWAVRLLAGSTPVGRVYGVSGGALVALAFALAQSNRLDPTRWQPAQAALLDFNHFLKTAPSNRIRSFDRNPKYGPYNLNPLRHWTAGRLKAYRGRTDLRLSDLPVPLYLTALDQNGCLTLFGPPDESLTFHYQFVPIGPPQDAPILDALVAALSTLLSTQPALVNGAWYRDARPAVVDAGALVADLEANDPRPILRSRPFTPLRHWKVNWITTSFIMHRYHERNQPILASYYLDLLDRQKHLEALLEPLPALKDPPKSPGLFHVNLPYVGSTEAYTNLRESVAQKESLMAKFGQLLNGQLDGVPFDQPANLIYGAGGFSGILAGLVTARAVNQGFSHRGGQIQQIYGISAGVLNGFFHAVQLAAEQHPDLYRPAARKALADLEAFIAGVALNKVLRFNTNPIRFWRGWGNLAPLEAFLLERMAAYTGSPHPDQIRFDDIALPLTVALTRADGFTGFFGMTGPDRKMAFSGQQVSVRPARVIQAVIAGWSMNTYVEPAHIDGEIYEDGGGAFYDIGLFAACLDARLTNLINIHLDEPEGHSYHLPARPDLVRIIFDTHNYTFPEERRRMFHLSNLLYAHFSRRAAYTAYQLTPAVTLPPLAPDFRREWVPANQYHEET